MKEFSIHFFKTLEKKLMLLIDFSSRLFLLKFSMIFEYNKKYYLESFGTQYKFDAANDSF